jgi:arginine repressor
MQMNAQRFIASLFAPAAITMLVLPWSITPSARAEDPANQPGGAAAIATTATATVKAIDAEKRTVTLQTPDGQAVTVKCGKDVVNFDQIKVGDQIRATAIERIAVYVGKAGAPNDAAGKMIALAPKGAKPGAVIVDTEQMTDKIDSVDAANHTVTLQGISGKAQTMDVARDVDLSAVQKGDDVVVRCTKGVAMIDEGAAAAAEAQPAAAAVKPGDTTPGGLAVAGATATATVESIDAEKRLVTLKAADGATKVIHLGKECINFDQIQVGDQVRATLAEEVAVAVSKGGAIPEAGEGALVARAPKGEKPAILIADSAQVTGKIDSVDADKRTITLTDADGKSRTIKAGAKVDISQLKAGDDVTARVTQALAIVVQKP